MVVNIDDSPFDNDEVRLLFRGNNVLHEWDKNIIGQVVRYYLDKPPNNENKKYGDDIRKKMEEIIGDEKDGVKIYETIKKEFNCKTNEKLIAYVMLGFIPYKDDLTVRLAHIFARLQRLKHRNDWLDNFTINAYIDVLSLSVYHKFDNPDLWSISKESAILPNKEIELDWTKCRKHLVGSFRDFLITKNLIPNCNVYDILSDIRGEKIDESSTLSDKDVVDISQMIFPYSYIGSHGCDCFFIVGMTLSINDIYKILKRYPSTTIAGIINTQTYRSGNGGEHWVYLGFSNGKANLICSEGSDFTVFRDGGCLHKTILKYFAVDYSMHKVQHDGFNCAFYSVLAAYAMMTYENDIKVAVKHIGDNAKNLKEGKSITDIRNRLINSEDNLQKNL